MIRNDGLRSAASRVARVRSSARQNSWNSTLWLERQQRRTAIDQVAGGVEQFRHPTGSRGAYRMLHFHRFHDQ